MSLPLSDSSLLQTQAYINGKWVDADSGATFSVLNPSTGEVVAEAHAVVRIVLVVPLLEPGKEVSDAGEERLQAIGWPALVLFGVEIVFSEGLGLLQVIPACPGDEERIVASAFGSGVADPAFFGHVEFATELPISALGEILARVFRGNRDVANVFSRVFISL